MSRDRTKRRKHKPIADASAMRSAAPRKRTKKNAISAASRVGNTFAAAPGFWDARESVTSQSRANLCLLPPPAIRSPQVFANYVPTVGTPRDSHTANKERVFGQDAWLGPSRPLIQ